MRGASDTFILGEQRRMPMSSLRVGSPGHVGYGAHGIFFQYSSMSAVIFRFYDLFSGLCSSFFEAGAMTISLGNWNGYSYRERPTACDFFGEILTCIGL